MSALHAHPVLGAAQRLGARLYVRTRPDLLDTTRPLFSSISRCCVNEGSAIVNGWARAVTGAEPPVSRPRAALRVGSARA
jgi:hypothetical protein